MPIYTIEDLRAQFPKEQQGLSDLGLIGEYAKRKGKDPFEVAEYLGVKTGKQSGPIGAGLSSGYNQLKGLGASAAAGISDAVGFDTGANYFNEAAQDQQYQAQLKGRPDLERLETQTPGSALDFGLYQIAKSGPTMAAIGAAQFIPGFGQASGALGLTRLGAAVPKVLGGGGLEAGAGFAARRAALAQGETLGSSALLGSGVGYGSLYQESVDGGNPDPYGSALKAIPYGLTEAMLPSAVRGAFRTPGQLTGNLLQRTGKAAGLGFVGESATESVQNELEMSMRSDLSQEDIDSRRLNSAVVGGLVGGSFGALGGIPGPRKVDPAGTTDLLNPEPAPETGPTTPQGPPPRLGYNPLAGTLTAFPDGSVALNSDQEFDYRFAPRPVTPDPYVVSETGAWQWANLVTEPEPIQDRINRNLGIVRPPVPNTAADFQAAAAEPSGAFVIQPEQGEQERQLDAGERQAQLLGLLQEQDQLRKIAETRKAELDARDARAQAAGLQGNKAFDIFGKLEQAVTDGLISKTEMAQELGNLTAKNPRYRQVEKFLEARAETKKATTDADKATAEATSRLVIDREAKASAGRAAAPTTQDQSSQGSTNGGQPVAAAQPGQPVGEVPLAPATVTVGRPDRPEKQQVVTKEQLREKLRTAPAVLKRRLELAIGDGSGPRSYDEVARLEALEGPPGQKPVGRDAISKAFAAYGITEEAITRAAGADLPEAVNPEELGITKTEEGSEQNNSGMRVEESLAKATSEGKIDSRPLTKKERELKQAADALLAPEVTASDAFMKKHPVPARVYDEGAKEWKTEPRPAKAALKAIKADLKELQAFRKCITGG